MSGTLSIDVDEYLMLKKKAKVADDALVQLNMSLEDIKKGKISKF